MKISLKWNVLATVGALTLMWSVGARAAVIQQIVDDILGDEETRIAESCAEWLVDPYWPGYYLCRGEVLQEDISYYETLRSNWDYTYSQNLYELGENHPSTIDAANSRDSLAAVIGILMEW